MELSPSIAVFYEILFDSHRYPFVMTTPEGKPWRQSNFRQRHWRPGWDRIHPENPCAVDHTPPIPSWFTFHEVRHTHSTWLVDDDVPQVARWAWLGQKMKDMARIYDHVTPVMRQQTLDALEARWLGSVAALTAHERAQLIGWFPHLGPTLVELGIATTVSAISISSPLITPTVSTRCRHGYKDR